MNLPNFHTISGSQELSGGFSAEEKVTLFRYAYGVPVRELKQ